MKTSTQWKSREVASFSEETLHALINNEIPALRLSGLATPKEIDALCSALLGDSARNNSVAAVTRLGISQYQHGVRESKELYFAMAKEARKTQLEIFAKSFDPMERLFAALKSIRFSGAILEEPGYGPYFAASGKLRSGESPIHVDFARQDSPDWRAGEAPVQLSWNYYLRVPEGRGDLVLWDKLWQREDDVHMVSDNYYFLEEAVAGLEPLHIPAIEGDIVFINSRNFHSVSEADGRLAIGSFISVFSPNQLRLWS